MKYYLSPCQKFDISDGHSVVPITYWDGGHYSKAEEREKLIMIPINGKNKRKFSN